MDREKYTRVSEILSIYSNYNYVSKTALKKATDLGTAVHEAIEADLQGRFYPTNQSETHLLNSYFMWKNTKAWQGDKRHIESGGKIRHIEKRLYDDSLKITGKPDLIIDDPEELRIIDFKTGSWAHPEIWHLQGEFYVHLWQLQYQIPYSNIFIEFVHLQKDESAPHVYEWESHSIDRPLLIQHAYAMWEYFEKSKKNSQPKSGIAHTDFSLPNEAIPHAHLS